MVKFKTGDLLQEDAEAIVNTVNCVGVMGRGIALQFKNAYPDNFKAYEKACKANEVVPGKMFVFDREGLFNPRYIINFPTKRHWRGKSKIEDIDSGLEDLVRVIKEKQIRSIAIPPLGSGLGGLDWSVVKEHIVEYMQALSGVDIVVFEPSGAPKEIAKNSEVPKLTAGRATLIELMSYYIRTLLDPEITLLEIQKLMYFTQASGEKLSLRFEKAPYGPYAANLSHVLIKLEGYYTLGYQDGGDAPFKRIELIPGAADDSEKFLENYPTTKEHTRDVVKLIQGFESAYGLELLSSVHWVAVEEGAYTADDVAAGLHGWNERKHKFTRKQIDLAYNRLKKQGWLDKTAVKKNS